MRTAELSGAALDWAVAKCEGRTEPEVVNNFAVAWYTWPNTHYSTDWAQGGAIIERECIAISCIHTTGYTPNTWNARHPLRVCAEGATPLIAAMRCYVASKLGDEVEIPEELR